ncbi:MAG: hypothetical protein RMZ41_014145 [Nostoc sp. DedVER02]
MLKETNIGIRFDLEKISVGCERKESGIKPVIIVRYELRSNTTPVATTEGTSATHWLLYNT